MKPLLTAKQYKQLKSASFLQAQALLTRIYREGFEDGLREAEQEYDDPEKYQIITEDEARATLGNEKYEELIHDHKSDL